MNTQIHILKQFNENLFSCIIKKTFVYCFSITVFVFIYKKHIKDITVSVFCRIVFHPLYAFNCRVTIDVTPTTIQKRLSIIEF